MSWGVESDWMPAGAGEQEMIKRQVERRAERERGNLDSGERGRD